MRKKCNPYHYLNYSPRNSNHKSLSSSSSFPVSEKVDVPNLPRTCHLIGKIVARHAGDLLLYSALIIHFCIFCKPHLLCCMPVLAAGLRFYNTLLVPTMFTLRATIDLNEISSRRKLCSIFYKIWPLRSLLTLLYVPRIKPVVRKKKA